MIKRVASSLPTFKTVSLERGFNIILADRTKDSTKTDTRNGLGKSTFIDVIHFCLGGRLTAASSRLAHPGLRGVSFSLELELFGNDIEVTRRTDDASFVTISGSISHLPLPEVGNRTSVRLSLAEWTRFLGQYWLGTPVDFEQKYCPTFRSAISYFMRSGKDAYSDPFRHFRLQAVWDIQVNNAFLLGLAWEDAAEWQLLKDKAKAIDGLKVAAEEGFLGNVWGSRGQLEADRIRIEESVRKTASDLKEFRVLSQYRELEKQADDLSARLEEMSNEAALEAELLNMYRDSVKAENVATAVSIAEVYKTASAELPDSVKKTLTELEEFHRNVVGNRRAFLQKEIERLQLSSRNRVSEVDKIQNEQSRILSILHTHGALDQYSKLQQAHATEMVRLKEIETRLNLVRRVEQERASLKIGLATLEQKARLDYEKRHAEREKAVGLFDANAQVLYDAPGRLLIDIGANGFKFGAEIDRKGSTGISNMEIFCYDLMLAEVWAERRPGSTVLVHDSNIFADVDDRQIAAALQLAHAKSIAHGFQYISMANSDKIPLSEFANEFNIDSFTRLRLTDLTEDGGLLGIRLPSTFKQTVAASEELDLFSNVPTTLSSNR